MPSPAPETSSIFDFPAIELVRPLAVFGADFRVELSTALTFSPTTVLHACTGMTLQTLLRKDGRLRSVRQLADAATGKHRASPTTLKTVLSSLGPFADHFERALAGQPESYAPLRDTPWQVLSLFPSLQRQDNILGLVTAKMAELDRRMADANAMHLDNDRPGAERLLATVFGEDQLRSWREFGGPIALQVAILVETCLTVLASTERTLPVGAKRPGPPPSAALELLAPGRKPIRHWLKQVSAAVGCKSDSRFADYLLRKDVKRFGNRIICADTLKAWGSMKPGMVMPLDAGQKVLAVLANRVLADMLLARFGLARFLAFLCDLLRSSAVGEALPWTRAQALLHARYSDIWNGLPSS